MPLFAYEKNIKLQRGGGNGRKEQTWSASSELGLANAKDDYKMANKFTQSHGIPYLIPG